MEDREKIVARVRKLLALAGNNPNEHEAAAAADRAQAMLAEYNLTLAEVQKSEGAPDEKFEFDATLKTTSRPWRRQLATMVAMMYFSKYFYTFHYEYTKKRACGYIRYDLHNFVGARHNLVVARMIFDYLHETIIRLAREGSMQYPVKERTSFQTSFQHTCANRLCQRIDARIREAKAGRVKAEAGGTKPVGTALVLADLYAETEKKLLAAIQEQLGQKLKTSKSRAQVKHIGGAIAGREAGDSISLDQQVGADKQRARIGSV